MTTRLRRMAIFLALLVVLGGVLGGGLILRGYGADLPGPRHDWPGARRGLLLAQPAPVSLAGIHKIRHVIVVMQENRSFDNYFGTYPGADGIPMRHGRATVCLPDPALGRCVRPFHDPHLVDAGGPHTQGAAVADVNG